MSRNNDPVPEESTYTGTSTGSNDGSNYGAVSVIVVRDSSATHLKIFPAIAVRL